MILVFNPGSSSLKFKVFENNSGKLNEIADGSVSNIGSGKFPDHTVATHKLCNDILKLKINIDVIGYRIVHSGGLLKNGSKADDKNIKVLSDHSNLAPLHNPQAIETIKACEPFFGRALHKMYFDTDFFKDLPEIETTYPIPYDISLKHNIRRFGFHGISHHYVTSKSDLNHNLNIISIHMGAGCSIAAIENCKPVATSMGFTPDEGLVMQTRSGDIDPGIIFFLAEKYGPKRAREIIEKESGLSGMTGTDGNMLNILYLCGLKIEDPDYSSKIARTAENKKRANFALCVYIRRIQKYIAYYAFLLGRVDKLVFTGKIGSGSQVIREMVTKDLHRLPISEFSVVKSDEELAIATEICQTPS